MLVHADLLRQPLERQAVSFPLVADQARVRGAQHDIDDVRELRDDVGQRVQHVLDPLVGRQQAECQQDLLPFHAELVFEKTGVRERHIRNPVRDDVDLFLGDFVNVPEKFCPLPGHDDQPRGKRKDFLEDLPLLARRLLEDGVECRYHRHAHRAQEAEHVPAGGPAVDPELVLDAQHVDVSQIQKICRPLVGPDFLPRNFEPNLRGIVVSFLPVIHHHHRAFQPWIEGADRVPQVGSEGRDAALAGKVIAEERDLSQLGGGFRVVGEKSSAPGGILLPLADWICLSHMFFVSHPHRKN